MNKPYSFITLFPEKKNNFKNFIVRGGLKTIMFQIDVTKSSSLFMRLYLMIYPQIDHFFISEID